VLLLALVATLSPLRGAGAAADRGPPPTAPASRSRSLLESPRLLGDLGGERTRLERLGIDFQLFYQQYLGWRARGGVDPDHRFGSSGSYDLFALVDVEELAGWPGLDLLLHVKGQYDENLNEDVAALGDPVDDADFDDAIYVDELWLQQALLGDRARLRAGFLEQQTLYDRNAFANSEDRQFANAFLDNNPLVPLPNGLGVALVLGPLRWLELAGGVADADNEPRSAGFDTAFDGFGSLNGYLELTARTRLPSAWGSLPGSYRVGVFRDGRRRAAFGRRGRHRGHYGGYLSFDQVAFREGGDEAQGLGLFARAGLADEDVNRLAWFWSAGLEYVGLLPGRETDVLGVGTYQTIGSNRYQDEIDSDFDEETGVEVYYRIAVLPWLFVTPDLQYIADPGASSAGRDAVVALLRLRVSF
jgi:porin